MKAINIYGKIYEVTSQDDQFIYAKIKGHVKLFNIGSVEVIEVEDKPKKYRKTSISNKVSNVDSYITFIQSELNDKCSGRTLISRIESEVKEMTDIVSSILSQANMKSGKISEKQIFIVAKFMEENNISLNNI